MAQQHVVPAVAIEVPDAREAPRGIRGNGDVAAAVRGTPTVHEMRLPATVRMAEQHVRLAVTIEVAYAARQGRGTE